jgi:hypothetical protein
MFKTKHAAAEEEEERRFITDTLVFRSISPVQTAQRYG